MSRASGKAGVSPGFIIVELLISGLFTLALFTLFILTGGYLIRLGLCAVWLLDSVLSLLFVRKKKHFGICIAEILIFSPLLLFFSLWAPIMSQSRFAFRYPFQKAIISVYNGDDTFDYFPEKLPKGVKRYRLDFFPAIMQADGYTTISFKAPGDVIEQYNEEYSKGAIYTCTAADLSGGSVRIRENGANPTVNYAYVRMGDDFKAKCSPDAMVYIMYNTEDSHRSSYTSAVVIDRTNNIIEFSKIG